MTQGRKGLKKRLQKQSISLSSFSTMCMIKKTKFKVYSKYIFDYVVQLIVEHIFSFDIQLTLEEALAEMATKLWVILILIQTFFKHRVIRAKISQISFTRYTLRYESSSLKLYKELSSTIFQSCQ